ncbi:MAG: glycosyltransferase family 4 protein [Lachnospiraceae bacterium]|nr:glycosyltransferase family 4 protein [Lachnospiraceae bacterium]
MGNDRLRVLMVGPDRSVHGGVSGMVNNYFDAGLNRKVDLCYIGTMVDGSKYRKLWQAVRAYVQFLVKLPQYDIVHVNMASDSSYYRKSIFIRTAKACRRKVVIHQHGGSFQEFYQQELSEKGRRSARKVLSMGDAFLVLGTEWKNFFGALIGEERITVLPNAVQIPEKTEKQYGSHKILFLGRLCKAKGIGELLDAVGQLREKYPDLHLYLAGVWEEEELRAQVRTLEGCVTQPGWIGGRQKQQYLRECDIFVLPSYFEGQPVSVLEAMANACGIVASEVGDIPDMIVDKETGFLSRPQDTGSLVEKLDKLLADPALCRLLGENARRKAETDFSIESSVEQLLAVYKAVSGSE